MSQCFYYPVLIFKKVESQKWKVKSEKSKFKCEKSKVKIRNRIYLFFSGDI
jgi:hypothetical protein